MNFLNGLNEAQKAAITAEPGPVLVLAGPGSGKTRVLTHRIVYLIQEYNVAPWNIMAVTFTNKAAREMGHRVETILGGNPRGLTMGTFHATCVRILRREWESLPGYDRDFVIFDTDDQRQVVKQALKDLNLDDKKFTPARMLNGISNAKNELVTADLYAATNYISEITRRVYSQYQDILVANNAMDFDDLLMNTVLLFDDNPVVLQHYQKKYEHILVDEFQDTNTAQYGLLTRLAAGHGNIFVVGDSDQSIYKWRGADFRNLNRFREQYPEAEMILLEQNYRSTQIILDAAKSIIRHNSDRVDKELFTDRKGGDPIVIREAYNEIEEADFVINTIQKLLLDNVSPGDCAIMYRTNAQSRVLEEAFLRHGMTYRLVGATRFYSRREIKDLIAYLRLVHNLADSVSLSRIINTPARGIGAKTLESLRKWASKYSLQPGEALVKLATDPDVQHPFGGRAYNVLYPFATMLRDWTILRDQVTVGDLLDTILEATDYRSYIDDDTEEGRDRWANVMELRGVAVQYEGTGLSEFLENVALVSDVDNLEEDPNAPTLLTLHAAKGLEFPIVFITGLEEGIMPHSRSMDDAEELAEERRLFYVGLTRAKDQLFLSHAFRRTIFGDSSVSTPSRFLSELPTKLVVGGSTKQRRQESKQRASSWSWDSSSQSNRQPQRHKPPANYHWADEEFEPVEKKLPKPNLWEEPAIEREPKTPAKQQYSTGQEVTHAVFGSGIVIESRSTGNDEEVTVAFANVGIKKLAASLAKLEIK